MVIEEFCQKNWALKLKFLLLFWAIPKTISKYIKKVEKLKKLYFLSKMQQNTIPLDDC
jgi:hypothetical protein